jgi:restriction endonuclease S subunit
MTSPKGIRTTFPKILIGDIRKIPIIVTDINLQNSICQHVDKILKLNSSLLIENNKFQRTLQRKFELESLPKKLENWYELSFAEFIKELAKKKVKLSLSEEAEWEDYFLQEQQKAVAIKNEIVATDKAIDKIVYELYGLSEEEISVVENS